MQVVRGRRGAAAVGRAVLAVVFVLAALKPGAAEPPYRPADGREAVRLTPGVLRVSSPHDAVGTIYMSWEGTIAPPMATEILVAFEAFRESRTRVVLAMNSGGGSVSEGERVIGILQRIRETHQLDTSVGPGSRCGSMCLPIYLQGKTRYGARASAWLFHEITRPGAKFGKQKRVEGSYGRLIDKYWLPAGVSRAWIEKMRSLTDNYDWWQTGQELIADNSGIITRPIDNRRRRNLEIEAAGEPLAKASPAPSTPRSAGLPPLSEKLLPPLPSPPEPKSASAALPPAPQTARPPGVENPSDPAQVGPSRP